MSISTEDRLKRRKLDALRRGVHRVSGGDSLPVSTHLVGLGRAGIAAICEALRSLEPTGAKLVALAVDIGEQDLSELRKLAATLPAERAEVIIIALPVPTREALTQTLTQYREFLALEYPRLNWNPHYRPWLPENVVLPKDGAPASRAVAKALYGAAYYGGERTMAQALRAFASAVDAGHTQAVVAVVFGLSGGTGSGIVVDLVRHLSNGIFGHRVLVAGIGIPPCEGDPAGHDGETMFPLLNELDCLNDEYKNRGVVRACGELFRNPFTAGFIVVPQQPAWESTRDLEATHRRVDGEIASLLTRRGGTNLWELLRLLNWVAAPSTQHSAARTPWGPRWVHVLGYADAAGAPVGLGPGLIERLGLLPAYAPEFIEMRVPSGDDASAVDNAGSLDKALSPDVPTNVVDGGRDGSVQFILPCASKRELRLFETAREHYDDASGEEKLLAHAMLLEQGVLLCEPSTLLDGMAGASLWGGNGWVAVPYDELRGDVMPPTRQLQLDQAS